MDCVAYMRVSTERQAEEGNGLDSQKRDIVQYASDNDMTITEFYIDDGYTGSNTNRPAFQKLINDTYSKKVNNVVVFKLDRLSRDMVDNLYTIEKIFIPNGVKLHSVHDMVDYSSPMAQAYTQMMAVFSQLDKNTMMLRMRGGMLERVKQGYWMGGGNLPYCYSYNKETGVLEIIEEKAEQARSAMKLYMNGYSDVKIAEILGFSTERIVRNILTGKVNVGYIEYKGNVYKGLHEPIFTLEEYNAMIELRKDRKKRRSYCINKSKMLTGLCFCGVCGCAMRYQKWSSGKYKIYCYSRSKGMKKIPNHNPNCDNLLHDASEVENYVYNALKDISLDTSKAESELRMSESEILQKELKNCETKLKRLYNLYANGNDDVLETINDIKEQKEVILEKIKLCKDNEGKEIKRKDTLSKIKKIADTWDSIDNISKNILLKSILDKIVIGKEKIEICVKNY